MNHQNVTKKIESFLEKLKSKEFFTEIRKEKKGFTKFILCESLRILREFCEIKLKNKIP